MKIIGLTGNIASGKSTVVNIFKEYNIPVCDTDQLARQVVCIGSDGLHQVVKAFGISILNNDGTLNRYKLSEIIFNDDCKRQQLNDILHPLIFEEIEKFKKKYRKEKQIIIDMPLLFEVGYETKVDEVLLIVVSNHIQKERLKIRDGLTDSQSDNRINAQMSVEKKRQKANVVIENNGTIEELRKKVISYIELNDYGIIR